MNKEIRTSYLQDMYGVIEALEVQIGSDEKTMTDGQLFRVLYFLRDLKMRIMEEVEEHDL